MQGASSEHLKNHVIVRAGAGAGKTRRLTHQVLDSAREFRAREGRWPRIVVTTFTRKATQELRERLMLKALEDEPELIDFVNSRSHLVVSTIHGVLDIYLKRYGSSICIDPAYAIMGGGEADRLARQVLRQALVENQSWQSLLETYGFNRLVGLLHQYHEISLRVPEAKPHSLETFSEIFSEQTAQLAAEMKDVADHIEAEASKEDWRTMATALKALAARLRSGQWESERDSILSEIKALKTARWSAKTEPVSDETNLRSKAVLARVRKLDDEIHDPKAWREFAATFVLFEELGREFSARFNEAKIRQGALEISDLELLAMDCIRRHPETVESFSQEWDYWLIDEYQDTSPFQVDLLRRLSGVKPSFIVGDPQQSIYLFRGARSEVFAEKESEILSGGGQQDFLQKNYRSRPELLLFFNDLFSRFEPPFRPMDPNLADGVEADASRLVAHVFVAPEPSSGEAKKARSNMVEAEAEAPLEPPLKPLLDRTGLESRESGDGDREMLALVRYVQDLLAAGAAPEDICVLARTNQTLLDVAEWLGRYRLPTHVHAASGFYSRRETMDALALLKFLVNPRDNLNTVQLLRSPWFRVPDEVLVRIGQGQRNGNDGSHWDRAFAEYQARQVTVAVPREPVARQELEAIGRLKRWLEMRNQRGVSETFRAALIDSGFIDFSHLHDMSGRRESNIWKLLAKLAQEERKPSFNYLDFISNSEVDLRDSSGAEESDAIAAVEPNRINLMTIHASKGLQFRHVIVPRIGKAPRVTRSEDFTFDEGRLRWALRVPRGEALDMTASLAEKAWLESFRRQELQEHARVLYVALTRAIETVFLSWTGQPEDDSWADMLRLDLTPGSHPQKFYTYTVATETEAPRNEEVAENERVEPRPHWDRRRQPRENTESRVKGSASVSEILEGISAGKRKWDALEIPTRLTLASRGTAVHRLMEALKCPAPESVRNLIRNWFPGNEEKVLKAVEFVTNVNEPPLAEVIRRGRVEWGFAFLHNGVFVEGQIDLWGRIEEGGSRSADDADDAGDSDGSDSSEYSDGADGSATVWVIDYKTGSPEGRERAFQQLGLYALALYKAGEIKSGDRVRLAAVYPFSERVFVAEESEIGTLDLLGGREGG